MAKDPYKYFRVEARELLDGMTQGVVQYEKGAASPDMVARLLRLAHTLKGAARVVRQPAIAEAAHAVEGILMTHRESKQPLSREEASELLGLLDEASARLANLEPAGPVAPVAPPPQGTEEPLETLRVEMREMDSLLRGVTEARVQLGSLRKGLGDADHLRVLASRLLDQLDAQARDDGLQASIGLARVRSLAEEVRSRLERLGPGLAVAIERVDGELAELRATAQRLRLIPAHSVFPSLERAVRDAAQALGRPVAFQASGGEVRLDANVLASLREALIHVARNAVAHGAQTEAERIAAGKSPTGHIWLKVERRGSRVAFLCSDDGRGVDVEAVRRVAIARGVVSESDGRMLSSDGVIALLGSGGLTTSDQVTELSGRGIGLDVARASTAQLKGELSIRSVPGRGATVELQVPVSIASLHALVVEAGGALVAIPLDAISGTLRVRDEDISRSAEGRSILHEGKVIPFLPLEHVLRRSRSTHRGRPVWSAIVVHAGNGGIAVGVDRLLATSNIVMRALPAAAEVDPVVSGASLDAEGNPQLVLDPRALVDAAVRANGAAPEEAVAARAPILVIDDSLTTRMLEQSILESAGYEVELAVSAEEALLKCRDHRYCLFVVDVEMPGMDGFQFVAETRADSTLRDIPAILVTSRSAAEDRRRGEQAGARGYIVKGEFDQNHLLKTIRFLIG